MEEQSKQKLYTIISYKKLNEHLSLLIENNLVEYQSRRKILKTTEKGLKILKIYNEIG